GFGLDSSLANAKVVPTVPVHVVGVTASELPSWEAVGVSEYFSPENSLRQSAKGRVKEFTFSAGHTGGMTISKTDQMWDIWASHGVTYLVVLADLPDSFQDQPGELDPRRRVVPLDKTRWPGIDTIRINVMKTGVKLETMPAAEKK